MRYKSTVLEPSTPDLTKQSFERLVVIQFAGYVYNTTSRTAYWTCECVCGTIKDIAAGSLLRHLTRSCGCLVQETTKQHRTIHGKRHTPEYESWCGMLQRCENPKDAQYPNYGERGITVCEQWHDFAAFYADMGPRPTPKHSLDRYPDNNGPYHPSNCRWATAAEQSRNQRTNHLMTLDGITKCLTDWASIKGFNPGTLWGRRRRGWSVERTLTTPARAVRNSRRRVMPI